MLHDKEKLFYGNLGLLNSFIIESKMESNPLVLISYMVETY